MCVVRVHPLFRPAWDCVPPTPRRCCAPPCHGSQLPYVRHYPCCHGPQLPPIRHYPRLRRPLQPSSSSFLSKLLLLSFPCSSSVSSKICRPSSTCPPCFILSASLLLRDVDCCIPSVYFPPLWFLYFPPFFYSAFIFSVVGSFDGPLFFIVILLSW